MFNWPINDHGAVNYGADGIFGSVSLPAGFSSADYHKYAMLITTDGVASIYRCSWVDDVFYACSEGIQPYVAVGSQPDNAGSVAQRNVLAVWSANLNWQNAQAGNCPTTTSGLFTCTLSDMHHWIKSIKVYSCQDWRRGSTGQNPTCKGGSSLTTGSDGSKFYKVTVQ
jgi:hypothetical protein